MKHIAELRKNIFLSKEQNGFAPFAEIILLMVKKEYKLTEDGEIIQDISVEDVRFNATALDIHKMIGALDAIKKELEEIAHA